MIQTRAFIGAATAAGFIATAVSLLGCDVHDNTIPINIPNAKVDVSTTANVDEVMPMQTVAMNITVQNVFLVDPAATPPADHVDDAGHLQFYIDDEANPPVLVTAMTNVTITIPKETPPGKHKIICRVHKHDGQRTEAHSEVTINVSASASATTTTTTNADGGTTTTTTVDAGVTVEVGTTTTTS